MRKYVVFVVMALIAIGFSGIYNSAESTPTIPVNPYVGSYVGWSTLEPTNIVTLNSSTWTNISAYCVGGIVESNSNIIIAMADNQGNADAQFGNGQYCILEPGEPFIIPIGQINSPYQVYAKCNSADIKLDYLDNAAAVNKGVTPEQVGLPVTGHTFSAGDFIIIQGTNSYDGTYRIISTSTNEIVIYCPYQPETFNGSETITATPTVEITCGQ